MRCCGRPRDTSARRVQTKTERRDRSHARAVWSDHVDGAVIVAVIAVLMVQATVYEVVHMVTVRDSFVPAARAETGRRHGLQLCAFSSQRISGCA